MFTYAEAETLLARLFDVAEDVQRGAFRGRLKHLKRLGIPLNSTPGRGKKVLYEKDHLYQWAYCLELEGFGMDPAIIARMVQDGWHVPRRLYDDAEKADGPFYGYIAPNFMVAPWTDLARIERWKGFKPAEVGVILRVLEETPHRLCIFDLRRVVDAVNGALQAKGERDGQHTKARASKR